MEKGKKWWIANIITGISVSALSIFSIITQLKSDKYEKELEYQELEQRYGLIPDAHKRNQYLEDRYGLEPIDVLADDEQ